MFETCLASFQNISPELTLLCLERLADISTGMNDTSTTLQWAGVFLGLTLKCKEKWQTMQAFCCID
jgi:hypothetical protein